MDKVPNIASNLTGGTTLPGMNEVPGAEQLLRKFNTILKLSRNFVIGNSIRLYKAFRFLKKAAASIKKKPKTAKKLKSGTIERKK